MSITSRVERKSEREREKKRQQTHKMTRRPPLSASQHTIYIKKSISIQLLLQLARVQIFK